MGKITVDREEVERLKKRFMKLDKVSMEPAILVLTALLPQYGICVNRTLVSN